MYRNMNWEKNLYIDNHDKYSCYFCKKTFIVGRKSLEMSKNKTPICPYCGKQSAEWVAGTETNQLEGLASDLGCLGIYTNFALEN